MTAPIEMNLKKMVLCLFALLFSGKSFCQKPVPPVLTEADFLRLVRENHPDVRQADNLLRAGEAEVLAARGGFDPKLFGNFENKTFDGKNYFTTSDFGAKMPTRFGTELKAAYSTAGGVFLNPSEKLPAAGQAVVGISQPVFQGLLFDERRANLRRARQSQQLFAAERQNSLNDLLFQATETYWKWAFADAQRRIFEDARATSVLRFENIKTAWQLGDRMAMDTLESFIQVQDRQFLQNDAELEWRTACAKLGNFWWEKSSAGLSPENFSAEKPLEPPAAPPEFDAQNRPFLENQAIEKHPALRFYAAKIAQLETEKRLKREKRKPKLNLNYNFLGNGAAFPVFLTDNYKWGIEFSSPIFFRTERGELQLANLKIENTQLDLGQKRRELQNKLRAAIADWENTRTQTLLAAQTLKNYRQLLELETTRFDLGESTFFLINSREMKFIEAQVKLAKLQTQQKISRAALEWVLGRFVQ